MKENFTQWLKCALIRAVKTMAQTAVAVIGTATMFNLVDWYAVASATLLAGVLSILTSMAGLPEVKGVESVDDDDDGIESIGEPTVDE